MHSNIYIYIYIYIWKLRTEKMGLIFFLVSGLSNLEGLQRPCVALLFTWLLKLCNFRNMMRRWFLLNFYTFPLLIYLETITCSTSTSFLFWVDCTGRPLECGCNFISTCDRKDSFLWKQPNWGGTCLLSNCYGFIGFIISLYTKILWCPSIINKSFFCPVAPEHNQSHRIAFSFRYGRSEFTVCRSMSEVVTT